MITIGCPQCGKELHIDDKYAGETGKCNGCGSPIHVPSAFDNAPVEVQAKQEAKGTGFAQLMLSIQAIGISMTACGCFLLFGLPILIFVVILLGSLI